MKINVFIHTHSIRDEINKKKTENINSNSITQPNTQKFRRNNENIWAEKLNGFNEFI